MTLDIDEIQVQVHKSRSQRRRCAELKLTFNQTRLQMMYRWVPFNLNVDKYNPNSRLIQSHNDLWRTWHVYGNQWKSFVNLLCVSLPAYSETCLIQRIYTWFFLFRLQREVPVLENKDRALKTLEIHLKGRLPIACNIPPPFKSIWPQLSTRNWI